MRKKKIKAKSSAPIFSKGQRQKIRKSNLWSILRSRKLTVAFLTGVALPIATPVP